LDGSKGISKSHNTMKAIETIVAVALCAVVFFSSFYIYQVDKRQKDASKAQEEKIIKLETKIASLDSNLHKASVSANALAKSVVYLDSCQQSKVMKQDRAERRGRFVGGLLRGLFPGI
jgi:uncharacterized protein YpmB